MLQFRKLYPLILLAALLLTGCQKEVSNASRNAALQVQFTHQVNGQLLQPGTTYTNTLGEPFSVNRFKYYISNLALVNNGRETKLPDHYFLVDEGTDTSKTIKAEIPAGTYTGLRFLLGVDSARNVSGAQTGALDPALDMFWTWNTGYIMAKLEGSSPISTAPNNRIQYHIGGFSGEHSSLRTVHINFAAPVKVERTLQVDLIVELQRWFNGVHQLPIAQNAVSMTPGALSAKYADNYVQMFRLNSVQIP